MSLDETALRERARKIFLFAMDIALDDYEASIRRVDPGNEEGNAKAYTNAKGALSHVSELSKLMKWAVGDSKNTSKEEVARALARAQQEIDKLEHTSGYADIGIESAPQ